MLLFLSMGCLLGAVGLFQQYDAPRPGFSELVRVSGQLTRVEETTRRRGRQLVLGLAGHACEHTYLDWFPKYGEVASLAVGERVDVWVEPHTCSHAWQVSRAQRTVVTYAEVRRAIDENRSVNPVLAVPLMILGTLGILLSLFVTRKQWQKLVASQRQRLSSPPTSARTG